ncbi:hypothetical protein TNCV_360291 [Trichonephila clavipes]|uniref:Uncharacterized protein n=1 Tax=Trichonephila clavipes TaxID=2585209 RepID=A0A8X6V9N4_TRICX|nr:hypothetical protein TNCV_360291 [Trichonephila clavipes]
MRPAQKRYQYNSSSAYSGRVSQVDMVTSTGASETRCVEGRMRRRGVDTRIFPVFRGYQLSIDRRHPIGIVVSNNGVTENIRVPCEFRFWAPSTTTYLSSTSVCQIPPAMRERTLRHWLVTLITVPLGLGSNPGKDMDLYKCIVPLWYGGTLNGCRVASPLVRLVEEKERSSPRESPGLVPNIRISVSAKYRHGLRTAESSIVESIPLPSKIGKI